MLSNRTFWDDGNTLISALSNLVTTSLMWLSSIWNVASVPKEWIFKLISYLWLVLPYWKAQVYCDSFRILFCSQPTLLIFSPHFSTRISFLKATNGYALSSLVIIALSFFYLTSQLLFAQLTRPSFLILFFWLCSMWDLVPSPVLEPVCLHWEHRILITEWPRKSWPDLQNEVFSAGVPWLFCLHPSAPLSYSIPVAGLFQTGSVWMSQISILYPSPSIHLFPGALTQLPSIRYSLCTDQNQLCVSSSSSPLNSEHPYPVSYFTYPWRFSISTSNLSCHLCPWIMAKTSPLFPLLLPSPHHYYIQCLSSSQKEHSKLQAH